MDRRRDRGACAVIRNRHPKQIDGKHTQGKILPDPFDAGNANGKAAGDLASGMLGVKGPRVTGRAQAKSLATTSNANHHAGSNPAPAIWIGGVASFGDHGGTVPVIGPWETMR